MTAPRPARPVSALLAALFTLALVLTGCAPSSPTPAPESAPPSASATGQGFPKDVAVGEGTVHLEQQPGKIVILGPSLTETVYAVGAGPQVVAVDKLSNYPADAATSDLDAFTPSAEAVASHSPDLVLLTDDMNNIVSGLEALQIPVAHLSAPSDVDGALAQFATVGELTGHEQEAGELVEKTRTTIADAVSQAPAGAKGTSYYWELDPSHFSVTSQTFIGSVLAEFGLENIADRAPDTAGGYPQLSEEFIIDADPDLIFLPGASQQDVADLRKRKGWDVTRAVKDENGIVTMESDVASRWGPRFAQIAVQTSEALRRVQ